MGAIHTQEINTAANWRGVDLVNDTSWILHFSDQEISALDKAVDAVKTRGLKFPQFGKDDFL